MKSGCEKSSGACLNPVDNSDVCLRSKPAWWWCKDKKCINKMYTCEDSTKWCNNWKWGFDMQECCPGACNSAGLLDADAPALAVGSCGVSAAPCFDKYQDSRSCLVRSKGWKQSDTCAGHANRCNHKRWGFAMQSCCPNTCRLEEMKQAEEERTKMCRKDTSNEICDTSIPDNGVARVCVMNDAEDPIYFELMDSGGDSIATSMAIASSNRICEYARTDPRGGALQVVIHKGGVQAHSSENSIVFDDRAQRQADYKCDSGTSGVPACEFQGYSYPGDICGQVVYGSRLRKDSSEDTFDECACPAGSVVACPHGHARGSDGETFFHAFFSGMGCACRPQGTTQGLPTSVAVDDVDLRSPEVPVLCAALTGNGGNWPITMSFVSETILAYLDEAGDEGALVDLNCVAGGSSASALTLVLMNLLSNPSFGIKQGQPATHRQARRVARALGLLAMMTDLQNGEKGATIGEVIKGYFANWGKGAWKKGLPMKMSAIVFQFARGIVLARRMNADWVDLPVADFIGSGRGSKKRENVIEAATAAGFIMASDVPVLDVTISAMAAIPETTNEQIESAVMDVSTRLEFFSHKFFDKLDIAKLQSQVHGVAFDETDVRQFNEASELDLVLQQAPTPGFMTFVYVQERSADDVGSQGMNYTQARVVAFMERSTAEAILRSSVYQTATNDCRAGDHRAYMCRYILAVVDKQRPMLLHSLMEPGNQKPHIARLGDSDVVAMYDPLLGGSDAFELKKPKGVDGHNPLLLFIGGFAFRGQVAMLQECYLDGVGAQDSKFIVWNKIVEMSFPKKVVKELMSEPGMAEANYEDFKAWGAVTPPNVFAEGKAVWNCGDSKLPAHAGGLSWRLRLHGAAVARIARKEALSDMSPFRPIVYDPMEQCEAEALAAVAVAATAT